MHHVRRRRNQSTHAKSDSSPSMLANRDTILCAPLGPASRAPKTPPAGAPKSPLQFPPGGPQRPLHNPRPLFCGLALALIRPFLPPRRSPKPLLPQPPRARQSPLSSPRGPPKAPSPAPRGPPKPPPQPPPPALGPPKAASLDPLKAPSPAPLPPAHLFLRRHISQDCLPLVGQHTLGVTHSLHRDPHGTMLTIPLAPASHHSCATSYMMRTVKAHCIVRPYVAVWLGGCPGSTIQKWKAL